MTPEFERVYYNDATVNRMTKQGQSEQEIIIQLVREKEELQVRLLQRVDPGTVRIPGWSPPLSISEHVAQFQPSTRERKIREKVEEYLVNTEAHDRLLNPDGALTTDGTVMLAGMTHQDCAKFARKELNRLEQKLAEEGFPGTNLGDFVNSRSHRNVPDFQKRVEARLEEYKEQWPEKIPK